MREYLHQIESLKIELSETKRVLQNVIDMEVEKNKDLKAQLECCRKENAVLQEVMLRDSALATKAQLERNELQNRLKAVYALSRMRASVISSWKCEELSIKVRKAISYLAKKEKTLRGES